MTCKNQNMWVNKYTLQLLSSQGIRWDLWSAWIQINGLDHYYLYMTVIVHDCYVWKNNPKIHRQDHQIIPVFILNTLNRGWYHSLVTKCRSALRSSKPKFFVCWRCMMRVKLVNSWRDSVVSLLWPQSIHACSENLLFFCIAAPSTVSQRDIHML